jgi:hypothetical protein
MRTNQRLKRPWAKLLLERVIAMIGGWGVKWNRREVGFGEGEMCKEKADFGGEMPVAKIGRRAS